MKKCFSAADILLPSFEKVDPEKWSVVACDQFTSEPEYWEKAAERVGDAPSTLNLILPEVYLSETEKRVPTVNVTMQKYMDEVLISHPESMVYIESLVGQLRRTRSIGCILSSDVNVVSVNRPCLPTRQYPYIRSYVFV